ncbi:hypothetical protein P154DRAFT_524190 [Amniculicola lignicola CBS 123094]|uniref:Uncharacterized protein n=1 Tax=Amniculicola lignicola CBS 123094 TaxID=1392246 RepID=A0A6A5WBI6_9PLEO|nr:hypothetical protein P154DRAFT_524190 [Amniculicola lignicola CBS 123094]
MGIGVSLPFTVLFFILLYVFLRPQSAIASSTSPANSPSDLLELTSPPLPEWTFNPKIL